MILAVLLLIVGLLAGLARGGKLSNIAEVELRLPGLVFVGLGLQVGAEVVAALIYPELGRSNAGLLLIATSYLFLIGFLVVNRTLPGALIVGTGLGLNLVVIAANRGMPVSVSAVRAAGLDSAAFLEAAVKHQQMGPGTRLSFLGDIIPVPLIGTVISVGDIFIGVGVFILVERLVRYSPRRRARRFN